MLPQTPTIEIHLAGDADEDDMMMAMEIKPLRSPYSPKFPSPMAYSDSDAEDFRPVHLVPPPTLSPIPQQRPCPVDKKGIDQERFAQLLKSSRERSTAKMGHARRDSAELRKQATLKAHTAKALERRATFLAKVSQPPSPSAADSPATPPDSPSVFYFSRPSPGLESPISFFEDDDDEEEERRSEAVNFPAEKKPSTRVAWVEEVDFKARARTTSIRNGRAPFPFLGLTPSAPHVRQHGRRASAHGLPSLDQITARLAKAGSGPQKPEMRGALSGLGRPRIPLGLHRRSPSSPLATSPVTSSTPGLAPAAATSPVNDLIVAPPVKTGAGVHRLPAFLQRRTSQESAPKTPTIVVSPPPSFVTVPVVAPRPEPHKPAKAAPIVLAATTVKQRLPFNVAPASPETRKQKGMDMVERLRRRSSAPSSLPSLSKRDEHPVLKMKGGF